MKFSSFVAWGVIAAVCVLCLFVVPAGAQQAPPPPSGAGLKQMTPPIQPKTQPAPLPVPVNIPAPAAAPPADVPAGPITATQAALIALRHQPSVAIAGGGLESAKGLTEQARSGLLPTLGFVGSYTHAHSLQAASTQSSTGVLTSGGAGGTTAIIPGFTLSATLRQLVFDFNHSNDLLHQAAEQQRSASANLTKVQSDLVLQVKQAFYTYAQNERLVTVNENNLQNQQQHLALAQAQLNAGVGLPSDVVRAQTAVAQAALNLNLAQTVASTSRINLALLMGLDPRTPIKAANAHEPAQYDQKFEDLVSLALKQRPDVAQAAASLQAARSGVSAARTSSAPSLGADVGVISRGASFVPGSDILTIGGSVSWDPFDSGLTAGRIREARGALESAQGQLTQAQLSVVSDVSQAYLNLQTAKQRVSTADAEVANAQETVRLTEGRYRAGLGTFLDVIDAQSALLTAQTDRVNAGSAVDQAQAALAHAVGAPLPTSGKSAG